MRNQPAGSSRRYPPAASSRCSSFGARSCPVLVTVRVSDEQDPKEAPVSLSLSEMARAADMEDGDMLYLTRLG